MVNKKMFNKIQSLRKQGKLVSEISRELKLDRKTVTKYYNMSTGKYLEYETSQKDRDKILDKYRNYILEIYQKNNNRKLNMASVYDCLEEKYGNLPCTEKTLRNYINHLIFHGELVIKKGIRQYHKVPELPFGKQMQLDFGQHEFNSGLKIYLFVSLLSRSRYKYISLQDRPFTTKDVIMHIIDSYEYYGGMPEEIVIDQDRTMVVSENSGDIIYTKDFSSFINEMDLKMYVCRKSDPQSKGKVENLVGYVKKNFLQTRDFSDITDARISLSNWLIRRGNSKLSPSTGEIPVDVITEERKYLREVRASIYYSESILREERLVNEHSFLSYKTCQYSVPKEYRNRKVEIETIFGELHIYGKDRVLITTHKISNIPGEKISHREHFRETKKKAEELKEEVLSMFSLSAWKEFSILNFKSYPRYVRDQCILARNHFAGVDDLDCLNESIHYCMENKTYSFKSLFESMNYFSSKDKESNIEVKVCKSNFQYSDRRVDVSNRSLDDYSILLPVESST